MPEPSTPIFVPNLPVYEGNVHDSASFSMPGIMSDLWLANLFRKAIGYLLCAQLGDLIDQNVDFSNQTISSYYDRH